MSTLILPRPSTQPDLYLGKYVAGLYAQDRRGIWYLPGDFNTLYQDYPGTNAVTAIGQPVGMILDKRQGPVPGPQLVSNPGPYTNTAPWVGTNGAALSVDNGNLVVTSGSFGYPYARVDPLLNVGKTYLARMVAWKDASVSQTVWVGWISGAPVIIIGTTPRQYSFLYRAAGTAGPAVFFSIANAIPGLRAYLSSITVEEIPGSHAEQATAVSRPRIRQDLSGAYNLQYDGIDDFHFSATGGGAAAEFFFCAAIQVGRVGSIQTLYSNASSNSGYRVRVNASNQLEFSAGNGSGFTTVATDAMVIDQRAVLTAWSDGARLYAQINNGPVSQQVLGSVATGTASATIGRDNGSATSHFMGRIYGLVTCHSQVDATHRSSVQQYLNFKMGGLL